MGLLKETMRKLKEKGVQKKEFGFTWEIMARNSLEILGGYFPNQKVFDHYVSVH